MAINLKGASAEERARYATLVRTSRLDLGMSQQQLATLAGVDRTTVSNVERGAGSPQADVLRRLLESLGLATGQTEDVEVVRWIAMIEALLLAVPGDARASAADAAIAAIATHVRDPSSSAAAASIPRIGDPTRGAQDAGRAMAAKRGRARTDEPHAD